jgi:hypothetical protein
MAILLKFLKAMYIGRKKEPNNGFKKNAIFSEKIASITLIPGRTNRRYGDMSYLDMKVIEFQGNANQKSKSRAHAKATRAADAVLAYEVSDCSIAPES